jgi:hypothetical protein
MQMIKKEGAKMSFLPQNTEGPSDVGFGMSDFGSAAPKSDIPNPTLN